MANEIVRESWFATDQAYERLKPHVFFYDFKVFLPDSLESEAVAHNN